MCYRKGYHRLLKAAEHLKQRTDLHFLVVGKTHSFLFNSYYSKLSAYFESHGISNFHLLGFVSDKLLHNLYSFADVYVSSSISEACNLSMQEAAQYGISMVITNIGAAGDLFAGEASILNRNCTGKEIARAIDETIDYKRVNYKTVNYWNWNKAISVLLEFYQQIINR